MLKHVALILTFCLATATQFACAQTAEEKAILGRWYSEYTEPNGPDDNAMSGEMKLAAVDDYLANGVVNSHGQITMSFKYKDGATLEAAWLVNVASEWQIKNGSLFEKIVDLHAIPDYVKANGELADEDDKQEFFKQAGFRIEDLMPKGHTTEDLIVSIDDNKFVYQSKDDDGKLVQHTKIRTQKNFSGYKK